MAVWPRASGALSAREARGLALSAQGIGARPRQVGPTALRTLLIRQGAVQLDSVNAVARAHELVPLSRLGPYRPADIYRIVYRERLMFEYWGHAMSWVPMAEYRYFLPRIERFRQQPRGWWEDIREHEAPLYAAVLERIRQEGPLAAIDFEDVRTGRGSWWDRKPAKIVLEDLFDQGILMVSERRSGFQRVYDLAERVIPSGIDLSRTTDDEAARHLLLRAACALGVGTLRDLADYFRLGQQAAKSALAALVEAGTLIKLVVEGWREPAYAPPVLLNGLPRQRRHRPLLVCPFDPLVWERSRALRLFGFEYRIEIYTPEPKRRYGYYVLPLLVGGALIGRVDARNDRASRTLRIPAVHLEPRVAATQAPAIASALSDLAVFLRAEHIDVARTEPTWLLEPLREALTTISPFSLRQG